MKALIIKTAVLSNKTAGTEGQPPLSERLRFTPLAEAEENQHVFKGPSNQSFVFALDNPESFGIFDGVTEALITIIPILPPKARAAKPVKGKAKPAKAAKPVKAVKPVKKLARRR